METIVDKNLRGSQVTEYSFGIEEEYFVVGRRAGNIKAELSQAFMKAASKELGSHLTKELLQSQIEVVTHPLIDAEQARQDLLLFRRTLAEVGQKYGIGILAAGTHPLARPDEHLTTNKRRYTKVIKELGIVGLGNALCGLHVHVEVPDPDRRVEIMHRLIPFLPILLALSTSSPVGEAVAESSKGRRLPQQCNQDDDPLARVVPIFCEQHARKLDRLDIGSGTCWSREDRGRSFAASAYRRPDLLRPSVKAIFRSSEARRDAELKCASSLVKDMRR